MHLTHEQQAVIDSEAPSVAVTAFAGTGKTTTLEAYTRARPRTRFTYLAFNRAVRDAAAARFGSNVRAVTAHSLAFRAVGARFEHKLAAGGLRPYKLLSDVPFLCPQTWASEDRLLCAHYIVETVNQFIWSADRELSSRHCLAPDTAFADAPFGREEVVHKASVIWRAMITATESRVPMTHDGYLKLYQLTEPELPGDVILFDEAQDANHAMLSMVLRQQGKRAVFVGDPHQQIYGFRGATSAFDVLGEAEHLTLSRSFRFGPAIGEAATAFLADAKGETRQLVGASAYASALDLPYADEPSTVVCRSNSSVIRHAIEAMDAGLSVGVVGDLRGYDAQRIVDVHALMYGGRVRSPDLRSLKNLSSAEKYARQVGDGELISAIGLLRNCGQRLIHDLQRLSEYIESNSDPLKTFVTAHKAKGLEFDAVSLADDFVDIWNTDIGAVRNLAKVDPEELNLLYVAMTRGRHKLGLSPNLQAWAEERLTPATEHAPRGIRSPRLASL